MMKNVSFVLTVLMHAWSAAAVPIEFVDEGVAAVQAITGAFAPNPRRNGQPMLLLSSKEGRINVLEDPDTSAASMLIADFSNVTCSNGERGLQTILPHPDFATNRFIFVYYTRYVINCPEDVVFGPSNRLSRFTINADTLLVNMESESIIMETPPTARNFHNGGSMAIGNDGFLYITTGDSGSREPPYAQDLANLHGKLIRLSLDGKSPMANPFSKSSNGRGIPCRRTKGRPPVTAPPNSTCEEIYAYGLRNPFRMAMDVNTKNKVRLVIGDVGGSFWEEINEGGSDYIGTNYRWPVYEGPCLRDSSTKCDGTAVPTPGMTMPFYYYQHTQLTQGGAITGSVFVPNDLWPPEYKYLFIDFIYDGLYNLVEDPALGCPTCIPPIPGYRNETFHSHPNMVDMFFGPYKNTKALYVITQSTGQNIRRIRYTASTNRAPTAVIVCNQTKIVRYDIVNFQGTKSFDPDGDPLTYLWNFGDGKTSTLPNPVTTYTLFGEYVVTLTVTDSQGQTSQTFLRIIVGTLPEAFVASPLKGQQFSVGEVIRLKANATDWKGRPIPDNQIFWEVKLHHAQHSHPFLDKRSGNDFDLFPAPAPEELAAAGNSYLEVIMSAVDSTGLTRTISRRLGPRRIYVDILSDPLALEVLVNENPIVTPKTILTWQNQVLRLDVANQGPYVFDRWNIGGLQKRSYIIKKPVDATRRNITAYMRQV